MPASNIGGSDVIGLSRDLKKRAEEIDEKRSGEKTGWFRSKSAVQNRKTRVNSFQKSLFVFV